MFYKSYLVDSVGAYAVEPIGMYDNDYNLKESFSYDGKTIYPFTLSNNTDGHKEILNSLALHMDKSASNSVQIYVGSRSEEEPLSGRTLLSEPISYEEEFMGFEKFKLSDTVTLAPGDTVYIAVDGTVPFKVRAFTKDSTEICQNTISMNSATLTFDGTEDKNVDATVLYKNGDTSLSYESMDTRIATVDTDGLVHPVAAGDTLIRVTTNSDVKYRRVRVRMNLNLMDITFPDVSYNGALQTPVPTVSVNGTTLARGTDYTFDDTCYHDNRNAGTATLTLTGCGNYSGIRDVTFPIGRRDLAETLVANDILTYHPDNTYPLTDGMTGDTILSLSKDGRTYSLTAQDINAGLLSNQTGPQTLRINGKGNFTGTRDIPVTVNPRNVTGLTVTLADNTDIRYDRLQNGIYRYTGEEVRPELVVTGTVLGRTRVFPTDSYSVVYTDNTDAYLEGDLSYTGKPSPKATITLSGNYSGTAYVKFNIRGALAPTPVASYDLSDAEWNDTYDIPYSPNGHTFHPTIFMSDGRTLTEHTDYEVEVESPSLLYRTGEVWVLAYGMGEYSGTTGHSYNITPRSMADVSISVNSVSYAGIPATPVPVLTLDGVTFENDFVQANADITYRNNESAGTGSIVLTGKGVLTGTKTVEFTITAPETTVSDPEPGTDPKEPGQPELPEYHVTLVTKEKGTAGTYEKGLKYATSNKKVLTVNSKGKVTAKGEGNADVTVKRAKEIIAVYHYRVEVPAFEKKAYYINAGESVLPQLKGTTFTPVYSVNKAAIADVAEDGTVMGKKKGSVKLTALIHGVKFTTTVNVGTYKLNVTEKTVNKGTKVKLSIKSVSSRYVSWNSSNTEVAEVNPKNGMVTTLAEGDAVVTGTVNGKEYQCRLHVDAPAFAEKSITMKIGETRTISVNGVRGDVELVNGSKKVITLSSNTVTAIKAGNAKVSFTANKKKFTCKIKVIN